MWRPGVAVAALVVWLVAAGLPPGGAEASPDTLRLELFCEDSPVIDALLPGYFPAMEATWPPLQPSGRGACASHFGHHTYLPGVDTVYALQGGAGQIVEVEQNVLSPARETPSLSTDEDTAALVTHFTLQVSLDGRSWSDVATGEHRVVSVEISSDPEEFVFRNLCDNSGTCKYDPNTQMPTCIGILSGCTGNNVRQVVRFEVVGEGQPFRYVRVHNPVSIYTGLSGFLDHSRFSLDVTEVGPAPTPALTPRTDVAFSCAHDIFEDIHPDDPCSFGGYVQEEAPVGLHVVRIGNVPGQWDAPSFFHTYALGDGVLDHISGSVVVRDYRSNGVGPDRLIYVETSLDGHHWERVHEFAVTPVPQDIVSPESEVGVHQGTFDATLGGVSARLVRLVSEPLPADYWASSTVWPDRHPWAYFLTSQISVDGLLAS